MMSFNSSSCSNSSDMLLVCSFIHNFTTHFSEQSKSFLNDHGPCLLKACVLQHHHLRVNAVVHFGDNKHESKSCRMCSWERCHGCRNFTVEGSILAVAMVGPNNVWKFQVQQNVTTFLLRPSSEEVVHFCENEHGQKIRMGVLRKEVMTTCCLEWKVCTFCCLWLIQQVFKSHNPKKTLPSLLGPVRKVAAHSCGPANGQGSFL